MARAKNLAGAIGMGLMLTGCSFASDSFWPSLSGSEPTRAQPANSAGAPAQAQIAPSAAERMGTPTLTPPPAPPRLGSSDFTPPPVTPGASTGTFVGAKVTQIRAELGRMQNDIRVQNARLQTIRNRTVENARHYHNAVGAIQARLQVGTTPGNPAMVAQWNAAQTELGKIGADVTEMNALATDVAGTSSMSAYLLESTRAAYGLSGAVEEDHRQLAILEDEVNRTVVLIDRLLNELSEDISRQNAYLGGERRNLTTLSLAIKNGELYGGSLANRAFASAAPASSSTMAPSGGAARRPLVVIRFDRPNVEYEQAVYTALSRALERRPTAMFDLVAVAPAKGDIATVTRAANTSKRRAETVLRSLADMGLPLERVRLSATTSDSADSNEVHIYVR